MSKQLPLFRRDASSMNGRTSRSWAVQITRKRIIIISLIIALILFLRSTKKDRNLDSTTAPTPYRIDWPSWPLELHDEDKKTSAFAASSFTPDALYQEEDLKPVTAIIYRVSTNANDVLNVVNHLLDYPFIKEIYIHNPMSSPSLSIEVKKIRVMKIQIK
ncbi:hypothetical protein BDC45DRAFT_99656 [Circinella umbellata]|nr:hypothetical protein BDC45DRAFT_99656 [Circinella umbellata]